MTDIGMAAFAVFFMQSPSFLSAQRDLQSRLGRSNAQTLLGVSDIPTDTHIKAMLDGVDPAHFTPVFKQFLEAIDAPRTGLSAFRPSGLGGRIPIALDGTEHFCSRKISCTDCLVRRKDEQPEYYHRFLSATIVAPGHRHALPLMPEFITAEDGSDKQGSEQLAAARWLEAHHDGLRWLRPVYLADALHARQPMVERLAALGADFIIAAKPGAHKTLYGYVTGGQPETMDTPLAGKGRRQHSRHYRWMRSLPLRDGKDARRVNWLECELRDASGKTTSRFAYITNLEVSAGTVEALIATGRARWKIENGTFNVLKTQGYNLEHNFGHGKKTLSNLLVTLNLLALALHTAADIIDPLWQQARATFTRRTALFEHIRTLTTYLVFDQWSALLQTIHSGLSPPQKP